MLLDIVGGSVIARTNCFLKVAIYAYLWQLSHRPIQSTWAKINMKVSAGFLISNTFQHPVLVRPLIAVFVFQQMKIL